MIVNGQLLAEKKLLNLKKRIKNIEKPLQLDILNIEPNAASKVYIEKKKEAGDKIGVKVNIHTFKKDVLEAIIKALCSNLNLDPNCTGYFIQLPISEHLNAEEILNAIEPKKDVDCLSAHCLGYVLKNSEQCIRPATVEAILYILKEQKVRLQSKVVTIINDSNLIGKPLATSLLARGATVIVCNEYTKDLIKYTTHADILISAVGKKDLITEDMVKEGSSIIDAGIVAKGKKVHGDVDFEPVSKKVKAITPVPGGVGPLTVACLFENLLKLYEHTKS